ncbi:hypothetical protein M3C81_000805 [Micrococcus luteus]|nr:hypothetical protein [Micrococcus luteus]
MELLIVLVLVGILGALVLPIVGAWLGFGLFLSTSKKAAKLRDELGPWLDERFDGRPVVTHTLTMVEEDVRGEIIEGAAGRGYALTNTIQSGKGPVTLVFEKRGDGSSAV